MLYALLLFAQLLISMLLLFALLLISTLLLFASLLLNALDFLVLFSGSHVCIFIFHPAQPPAESTVFVPLV